MRFLSVSEYRICPLYMARNTKEHDDQPWTEGTQVLDKPFWFFYCGSSNSKKFMFPIQIQMTMKGHIYIYIYYVLIWFNLYMYKLFSIPSGLQMVACAPGAVEN